MSENETPDLSTLPARMRYAAEVLSEVLARQGECANRKHFWSPGSWRYYASKFEAEDAAAAVREEQVEELASTLYAIAWRSPEWDHASVQAQSGYCEMARKLIDAGWSKS